VLADGVWHVRVRGARDRFNAFDGFIVTMSILELILSPPAILVARTGPPESGGAVSALRTFRLFRVFSIARYAPPLPDGGCSGACRCGVVCSCRVWSSACACACACACSMYDACAHEQLACAWRRSWVSLRMLLRAIVKTLKDVANFALLLLLFLYIFSIVGMQVRVMAKQPR